MALPSDAVDHRIDREADLGQGGVLVVGGAVAGRAEHGGSELYTAQPEEPPAANFVASVSRSFLVLMPSTPKVGVMIPGKPPQIGDRPTLPAEMSDKNIGVDVRAHPRSRGAF